MSGYSRGRFTGPISPGLYSPDIQSTCALDNLYIYKQYMYSQMSLRRGPMQDNIEYSSGVAQLGQVGEHKRQPMPGPEGRAMGCLILI